MIVKLQKLPKEFRKPRSEPNLLVYKDFQILVLEEKGKIVGSVRAGISTHNPENGLTTDLWISELALQDLALQGYYARLLKEAESSLKKLGVKKVDAYYLDGPGKLEHFYKAGYVPERRMVQILWDLKARSTKHEAPNK
ncbi:MAG: GNAT family N-acetyltransferase, partial [bacterium]|nr:GNAT family N-acetyltransferase [bacterium]